jgi:hypothetical protein
LTLSFFFVVCLCKQCKQQKLGESGCCVKRRSAFCSFRWFARKKKKALASRQVKIRFKFHACLPLLLRRALAQKEINTKQQSNVPISKNP